MLELTISFGIWQHSLFRIVSKKYWQSLLFLQSECLHCINRSKCDLMTTQRLLNRSDSERFATGATQEKLPLKSWAICTLVASCCNRPVIIQPLAHKDGRHGNGRRGSKKKKIPSLFSNKSQERGCYPSGLESRSECRTPLSHPGCWRHTRWKICPSSDADFKCAAITIPISRETEYFTLAACGTQRWFLMNRIIFASVVIYINTGHYHSKSGQTTPEQGPDICLGLQVLRHLAREFVI